GSEQIRGRWSKFIGQRANLKAMIDHPYNNRAGALATTFSAHIFLAPTDHTVTSSIYYTSIHALNLSNLALISVSFGLLLLALLLAFVREPIVRRRRQT